jgi:hypothetical protein
MEELIGGGDGKPRAVNRPVCLFCSSRGLWQARVHKDWRNHLPPLYFFWISSSRFFKYAWYSLSSSGSRGLP